MKVSRKLNKESAMQRYPSHVRAPGRGSTGLEALRQDRAWLA